jgi:hypothetical protein
MQRIINVSRFFRLFFTAYLLFLPLWILFHWFVTTSEWIKGTGIETILNNGGMYMGIPSGSGSIKLHEHHFSLVAKFIGLAGSIVQNAIFAVGVYYLIQLFKLYEKGSLFTRQHVNYFKDIGIALAIYSTLGMMLSDMIFVLAATFDNAPGTRMISIGFGTTNLEVLVISALIILTSWIMAEGFKLKQEQELTI